MPTNQQRHLLLSLAYCLDKCSQRRTGGQRHCHRSLLSPTTSNRLIRLRHRPLCRCIQALCSLTSLVLCVAGGEFPDNLQHDHRFRLRSTLAISSLACWVDGFFRGGAQGAATNFPSFPHFCSTLNSDTLLFLAATAHPIVFSAGIISQPVNKPTNDPPKDQQTY